MLVTLKKLKDWGINVGYENSDEVICFCPFHNNTHSPAFSINKKTGVWICFNESCGSRGNLRDLAKRLDIDVGISFNEITYEEIQDLLAPKQDDITFPQDGLDNVVIDYTSEEDVEKVRYLLDRGFSPKTLRHFEIGFSEKKERVVIPARNEHYQLVGLIGRAIREEQKPKYLYTKGFGRAKILFNLQNAKHFDEVIVVEGSLDALKVHQAGFPNVVATLGSAITEHHMELLRHHFYKIVIFSDNDVAGKRARDGILDRVPDRELWVVEYPSEDYKDPGDLTEEQISEMIENSVDYLGWVLSIE